MDSKIISRFGRTIRRLREGRGLTQEELGKLAKLHRTYIGMIERGEKNITLGNIEKLSKALKTPVRDLF
ncbi:MAG: helix-turn-helix transcriptional regulator [Candidatus Peribacteraceae bacterium]|nr:helix-turn-helix transcriptional regulator [Candidatus Peribacteraceae bacterium]